jgi:TRAP-type C4-dicarboxylate transport system substrate-binding protein
MEMANTIRKSCIGIGAAVAMLTGSAVAQDYPSMNLRLAHFFSDVHVQSQVDKWWAEEITRRSNGKVKVTVFWNEALGKSTELVDLLGSGAVDIAATALAYTPSKLPLSGATNALPLVIPDIRDTVRITHGLIQNVPEVKQELQRNNIWPLYFHSLANYHLICNKPVRKLEDFKGLKIRSFGAFQPKIWEALGAVGVVVLQAEVYEGLQRGRVDCVFNSYSTMLTGKLYEVGKYLIDVDFGPLATWPMMVNYRTWHEKWPENVKKLFSDVSAEAEQRSLKAVIESDDSSLKELVAKGTELIKFQDQEKMLTLVPDMLKLWQESMIEKGLGPAAEKAVTYWRAQVPPRKQ